VKIFLSENNFVKNSIIQKGDPDVFSIDNAEYDKIEECNEWGVSN
jgi:hypothetical protein